MRLPICHRICQRFKHLLGVWQDISEMTRCINLCAGVLLTVGFSGVAFAADLAVKAPALAPVPFTWTGCYVGGHIGGVVSDDRTTNVFGSSVSFSSAGFLGGGQIGCDYQFATSWVVGAEGRAAWSSLRNSHAGTVRNLVTGVVVPSQFTMRNDFLASATARLGYTFADRWLVFVRGGAAWTHEKIDDAFTNLAGVAVDPSSTTTRTGWTAGIGGDWAFAQQWSAVVEYDYYDFGHHSALLTNGAGATVTIFSLKDRIHAVTAGVNYHF
jgi:outer membrane immunogenic protein